MKRYRVWNSWTLAVESESATWEEIQAMSKVHPIAWREVKWEEINTLPEVETHIKTRPMTISIGMNGNIE
jgi:hypothetical protein